jgi:hypothetical protein
MDRINTSQTDRCAGWSCCWKKPASESYTFLYMWIYGRTPYFITVAHSCSWMSCIKVLISVFKLRVEISFFFFFGGGGGPPSDLAFELYGIWVQCLTYLAGIYTTVDVLNLSLQGKDTTKKFGWIGKCYNIRTVFKSDNTLLRLLFKTNPKTDHFHKTMDLQ